MSDVVRQLSALVGAGLPAIKARQLVQEQLDQVSAAELKHIDLIFDICVKTGGPIAASLDRLANVMTHRFKQHQQAQVAFAAPKGTPAPVIERLNKEINAGLNTPEAQKSLNDMGLIKVAGTPEDAAKIVYGEIDRWTALIKQQGFAFFADNIFAVIGCQVFDFRRLLYQLHR
jgi:hypothetical protein